MPGNLTPAEGTKNMVSLRNDSPFIFSSFLKNMRIWDIEPKKLCRQHLLGEHHELHALWSILINHKKGFSQHPETKRWVGKTKALYLRHEKLVQEMKRRHYRHNSPLDRRHATGSTVQKKLLQTKKEQIAILKSRHCDCLLD